MTVHSRFKTTNTLTTRNEDHDQIALSCVHINYIIKYRNHPRLFQERQSAISIHRELSERSR